jgi:arylsulfatase
VYEFKPDSTAPGAGGMAALSVDGKKVAEKRIRKTQPFAFSADEGADVGVDAETNVFHDYKVGNNRFTGNSEG